MFSQDVKIVLVCKSVENFPKISVKDASFLVVFWKTKAKI